MKNILTLLCAAYALLITGCTAIAHFDTVQPAAVNIPPEYKKVVLLNRTRPAHQFLVGNKFEQIMSGDWGKKDENITFLCLNALSGALSGSMKHYEVDIINDKIYMGTGNESFPTESLAPAFIDSICRAHNADFVIALEAFDISVVSKVNGLPATFNVVNIAAVTPSGPTFTLRSVVNTGWRIYPARGSSMIDQFINKASFDFGSMSITDQEVLLRTSRAREGLNRNCSMAGEDYAYRITPHPVTLHREWYTSGSASMKEARRLAFVNRWNDAFSIWQANSGSGKRKVAFRSLYNLAVYYEMCGKLDEAIKTAEDAYVRYHKRAALYYSDNLKFRKGMDARAQEQLGNNK